MSTAPDLLGLPFPALAAHLDALGVGARHTGRVFRGMHHFRLPLDQIENLGRHAPVIAAGSWRAEGRVEQAVPAPDGTVRLVIGLHDGARVESVIIPMREDRATLCISTQVGCAMACAFCATGTLGLTRHLRAGEIVAQVHAAQAYLEGGPRRLRNLVLMGMGEPLHNYEAVLDALRVLLCDHGASFRNKHITVSTVGLVPKIHQLAEDLGGRVQLALSLHAGTDAVRQRIIPTARKYPLAQLREALLAHPLPGSRALMLEYVVLPGVNDTVEELDGVGAFAEGLRAIVNLIPFNPFPGAPFESPTHEQVLAVHRGLRARGVAASIRWPRGREASGACGQLMLTGVA